MPGVTKVLLRKGGIREATFRPAASRFLLLPTSFHSDAQLLKPRASLKYSEVTEMSAFLVVPRVPAGRLVTGLCIGQSWPQQNYVTTILLWGVMDGATMTLAITSALGLHFCCLDDTKS